MLHLSHSVTRRRPAFSLSKPSLLSPLHFHTQPPIQDLPNLYVHLLQSHPQILSIKQIHAKTLIDGSSRNSFTSTHLIKSYAKFENIQSAWWVFENVNHKRVFLWNAMIRALSRTESWEEIISLYRRMEEEKIEPDHYTLPFVIKAFSVLSYVQEGKKMHNLAIELGLVRNAYVATALMEMYIKFGEVQIAFDLFVKMPDRDLVAWTSMISGYVEYGYYSEALRVFSEMRLGGIKPNWITVLSLIPACDHSIHSFIVKCGFDSAQELQIALLNLYVKVGDIAKARALFDRMSEKNLVSWTVMVSGYSQNGYANEALTIFYEMLTNTNLKLDSFIAATVLQACAQLASLNYGKMVHGYILREGVTTKLEVETSLVDMYAKCGSLTIAQRIFDGIENPNIFTWSALISGYGSHGFGSKALDLFEKMKTEGFIPDKTAFLSVLSACSHSGLVCEGIEFFEVMQHKYMVTPGLKHYACMIDLFGRAGLVSEAWNLVKEMPFEPDASIWGTLVSASKIRGNIKIAERACKRLLELNSDNTDYHVLLANIYSSCGKWNEASEVRSDIKMKGEKKIPGYSYIEVNCKIHEFFAGDKSHPESRNLSSILEMLHCLASDNH